MKIIPLKIRLDGDPCLRIRSDEVDSIDVSERMLVEAMIYTMYKSEGIGLAAPQVGINKRIFVFDVGEGPVVVANPQILKREDSVYFEEGCLSIPNIIVNIERSETIFVSYADINNKITNKKLKGISARVFMHENDHLDGKLITDYASKEDEEKFQEQIQKIHEMQKEKS